MKLPSISSLYRYFCSTNQPLSLPNASYCQGCQRDKGANSLFVSCVVLQKYRYRLEMGWEFHLGYKISKDCGEEESFILHLDVL